MNGLEVFNIQLEPTRIVRLPYVTDLKGGQWISPHVVNQNHYFPYAIHEKEHVFPKTFALYILNIDLVDFIDIRHFSIWIIEPRAMFLEGDRIIVQTIDQRLFAGKSKLLTGKSLMLRNDEDVNCEVIDFVNIHFIGRIARGISSM